MASEPEDSRATPGRGHPGGAGASGDLDKRLADFRHRREEAEKPRGGAIAGGAGAMGVGFRIAVEIVAGLAVGVALGLTLDHWLGTKPWLFIVCFFLGAGASMMNVIRAGRQIEAQRKAERAAKRGE